MAKINPGKSHEGCKSEGGENTEVLHKATRKENRLPSYSQRMKPKALEVRVTGKAVVINYKVTHFDWP